MALLFVRYGRNVDTGVAEVIIDTGIPEAWGDQYYYPTEFEYRTVVVAEDSILVFVRNTYQYAYQGRPNIYARNTFIYKVT